MICYPTVVEQWNHVFKFCKTNFPLQSEKKFTLKCTEVMYMDINMLLMNVNMLLIKNKHRYLTILVPACCVSLQ